MCNRAPCSRQTGPQVPVHLSSFAVPCVPNRSSSPHFKPSFLPAASSWIASFSRRIFVDCCLAESIQPMYIRRYEGARLSKKFHAVGCFLNASRMYRGTFENDDLG